MAPVRDDPARSPSEDPLIRERRIAALVSIEDSLSLVRELASLGPRTGGTASGERALSLTAGRLRDMGLAVEFIEDPAVAIHEARSWSVTLDGLPIDSAHPWIHSPGLSPVTLPLRLDPDGGEAAPGGGPPPVPPGDAASLKGSVVLTSRDMRTGWKALHALGASAVLTGFPSSGDSYREWAFIGELSSRDAAPEIPVFGLSHDDLRALREAHRSRGEAVPIGLSLVARNVRGSPRTIVGRLEGAGVRAGRSIIVCAHGDADGGGPGADDNASGIAALVEVARALAGAHGEGWLPANRPRVLFIVWGKEIHSSTAWVRAREAELGDIEAVVNFDQVGTGTLYEAIYYEGNDIPWNRTLLRTIESVARDHAGREGMWTRHTSNPALGGTDAYAFLPEDHAGFGLTSWRSRPPRSSPPPGALRCVSRRPAGGDPRGGRKHTTPAPARRRNPS